MKDGLEGGTVKCQKKITAVFRCGACCRVIPLSIRNMHPDAVQYYLTRGLKIEQGFILIPHDCQHLIDVGVWYEGKNKIGPYDVKTICNIHDDPKRPKICQRYHGQKQIGPAKIYVPPGCVFADKK